MGQKVNPHGLRVGVINKRTSHITIVVAEKA